MHFPYWLATAGFIAYAASASAHEFKVGELQIDHPWSRATPAGAKVGGGYLKITNKGPEADRFIGGSSAAAQIEIHESTNVDGIARMRQLKDGVVIPSGATIELMPGGTHLMFVNLAAPLKKGEKMKATLMFEKAGSVDVEFAIDAMGEVAPDHNGHGAAGQ